MTLNQIAAAFCDAVKKPFDHAYIERIKFSIKYWRATLIRQDFERNGRTKDLVQSFIMPLIVVDSADSCVINIGCNILRTENKVPKPVRIKGTNLFNYVGSIAHQSVGFIPTDNALLPFIKYKRYTKNIPHYVYINDYIYIYTDGKFKYIKVESVFVEPEKAVNLCANNCPSDDDEFPIGADMIQAIFKGLISGEMQIMTDDIEVQHNDKKV